MTKFVVFGQARSGSTLLVRLLQSHPQIQCDGEILGRHGWRSGVKKLLHGPLRHFPEPYIFWKATRSTRYAYGFKLLINQTTAPSRTIRTIHARGWQIIHIQRRSLFDQALSRAVASLTSHWAGFNEAKQSDTAFITIPPDHVLIRIRYCVENRQKSLHALKGIPHILVTYEDDLLDEAARNHICGEIFQALGVEQRPVSTTRQRSWNRPYSELIVNYDELLGLMETTEVQELQAEWERLFD